MNWNLELPSTKDAVYLNTGAAGPIPRCVNETMLEDMEQEFTAGRVTLEGRDKFFDSVKRIRRQLGELLNADPLEIAITHNTTEGMNIVLWGLDLQRGDQILTTNFEHISGLAGILTLHKVKGVEMVEYQPADAHFDLDEYFKLISEKTKLIMISHVSWTSGLEVPIKEICAYAHERGIFVLVDGAQSVGAIPVDVKALGVDFYAFPAQKWLLGPEGAGGLYISSSVLEAVHQTFAGCFSFARYEGGTMFTPNEGSSRYEIGTRFRSVINGWSKSLEWLNTEVGWDVIYTQIKSGTGRFKTLLLEKSPFRPTLKRNDSGLITFDLPEHLVAEHLVTQLIERRVYVRTLPNRNSIRVSVGFYNTEQDFEQLLQHVEELSVLASS